MPAIARGIGSGDKVLSAHGTGTGCKDPATYDTDTCSSNVMVAGTGAVRATDTMQAHPDPEQTCAPHSPACSTFSSTVMVNGLGVARLNDLYTPGHEITTVAQSTVIAG